MEYSSKYFSNRELSWLKFNSRVLEEGKRKTNPLLERLKYLAIMANNMDEFFEIRVSSLEQKLASDLNMVDDSGYTPKRLLKRIYRSVQLLLEDLYDTWNHEIRPELKKEGYHILRYSELDPQQKAYIDNLFFESYYPVLTPIKVDPTHPFPWVINKALCIAALLDKDDKEENQLGVITVPRMLPRIIEIPGHSHRVSNFIFLSQIIKVHMQDLFKGYNIKASAPFRITRNSNLYFNEEEVSDLISAIESELHNRKRGDAVRLEVQKDCPQELISSIQSFFDLEDRNVHKVDGPVNFNRVLALYKMIDRPDLKFPNFTPVEPVWMTNQENIFNKIKEKDILLHHPYESFTPIIHLLEKAAKDPNVFAIKMTLYRTGEDSPLMRALIEAAKNGKEVTVVVELKARFDEESNVQWAKYLIDNGVHVVYGLIGLKTHCKLILIVRREENKLIKYVHLGTGNYNENTARLYTDLSLFTCNEEITKDALDVFNALTTQAKKVKFNNLLVSPFSMLKDFIKLIENETEIAKRGEKAKIIFKVNALQEKEIIKALYDASRAGVEIIGIVRGICCLRPGRLGYSENIKIISIVGRYLEHARIFHFQNAKPFRTYIASSDWMPRNLRKRVEIATPIIDQDIEKEIIENIIDHQLKDNIDGRVLYKKWIEPTQEDFDTEGFHSSQRHFMKQAIKRAKKASKGKK